MLTENLTARRNWPYSDDNSLRAWLASGRTAQADWAERSRAAAADTAERWRHLCMPLHALGAMERLTIRLAGQQGGPPSLEPAALFVFCGDHGVVAEGVTQTGSEVTSQVLVNLTRKGTNAALYAEHLGVDLFPIDVACRDYEGFDPGIVHWKLARGTENFAHGAAMSREQCYRALAAGSAAADFAAERAYRLLIGGEMGIGNTSAATAILAALLQLAPEKICGRGAGLSDEGLRRKQEVLAAALRENCPPPTDPIGIMARYGGYELAALTGLILGALRNGLPLILDGLLTAAAALTAYRLAPACRDFLIPSHKARELASQLAYKELKLEALLDFDLALGEGAGALFLLPALRMALLSLTDMPRFEEGGVETYEDFQAGEAGPEGL